MEKFSMPKQITSLHYVQRNLFHRPHRELKTQVHKIALIWLLGNVFRSELHVTRASWCITSKNLHAHPHWTFCMLARCHTYPLDTAQRNRQIVCTTYYVVSKLIHFDNGVCTLYVLHRKSLGFFFLLVGSIFALSRLFFAMTRPLWLDLQRYG